MSRISNRVLAGLSAGAFAVLMSQTALAAINVHVSVPTIHISVPAVHVSVPTAGTYAPSFKAKGTTVNLSTSHHDHQSSGGDRRGRGAPIGTPSYGGTTGGIVVYSTTVGSGRNGGISNTSGGNGGNLGTGSGQALTLNTAVVGGNSVPVGLYNPNCDGAADCGVVTVPVKWTGTFTPIPPFPDLNGDSCSLPSSDGKSSHTVTIPAGAEQTVIPGGSAFINGTWQGDGNPKDTSGWITANPGGTYNISFSWPNGKSGSNTFTGTLTWTPGPNGGGSWTMTGTVTSYNAQGQVVPGGPGSGSCTLAQQ